MQGSASAATQSTPCPASQPQGNALPPSVTIDLLQGCKGPLHRLAIFPHPPCSRLSLHCVQGYQQVVRHQRVTQPSVCIIHIEQSHDGSRKEARGSRMAIGWVKGYRGCVEGYADMERGTTLTSSGETCCSFINRIKTMLYNSVVLAILKHLCSNFRRHIVRENLCISPD